MNVLHVVSGRLSDQGADAGASITVRHICGALAHFVSESLSFFLPVRKCKMTSTMKTLQTTLVLPCVRQRALQLQRRMPRAKERRMGADRLYSTFSGASCGLT